MAVRNGEVEFCGEGIEYEKIATKQREKQVESLRL